MKIIKIDSNVYEINFTDGVKKFTSLELIKYLSDNGYQMDDLISITEIRDIKISSLIEDYDLND
jgi:hypothetical protein